jgi:hypothetical protein
MNNLIMECEHVVLKTKTFKNVFWLIFFAAAIIIAFTVAAHWW